MIFHKRDNVISQYVKNKKFPITCIAEFNGRFGIAVAANSHIDIISDNYNILKKRAIPPSDAKLIYFHKTPGPDPINWMKKIPTIGYWVVESSRCNPEWKKHADALRLILTPSKQSKEAIDTLGSNTDVHIIPHPISIKNKKHAFKKDKDTFRFLCCMNPPLTRKNPEGAINAFKMAFPEKSDNVELTLKIRRLPTSEKEKLLDVIGNDSRIKLLVGDLNDIELEKLYLTHHCYYQTHRAGAFELHCAEAASYGIPVIATKMGGPCDYLPEDCLIDGKKVKPGAQNRLNDFGYWIEPDLNDFASMLSEIKQYDLTRREIGIDCKSKVEKTCNPKLVREKMIESFESVIKTL